MDYKGLGKRIKIARKDRKITSEKLSELCNLNATYLRQIESGKKTPSLPVFVSLCQELRVSPDFLLMDSFNTESRAEMTEVQKLLANATPNQTKMIVAMIKCALKSID